MKVTRNTSEQLVLDYTPWFLAIALTLFTLIFVGAGLGILLSGEWAGLIFLIFGGGMGLIAMTVFIERLQIVLNRSTGKVRIRRQTLRGYKEDLHELANLRGATVQSSTSSKGGTTYRPALLISNGTNVQEVPITQVYSSGGGASTAVDAIVEWLGPDAHVPEASGFVHSQIVATGPARGFSGLPNDPMLGDVLKAHPRNSGALLTFLDQIMCGPGELSRGEREMIASHVSERNGAEYCVIEHSGNAEAFGIDTMNPGEKLQSLLDYAGQVNAGGGPAIDTAFDVACAQGWSETALYEAVEICGAFNLINRIVRAAGIEAPLALPTRADGPPSEHSYLQFAQELGV